MLIQNVDSPEFYINSWFMLIHVDSPVIHQKCHQNSTSIVDLAISGRSDHKMPSVSFEKCAEQTEPLEPEELPWLLIKTIVLIAPR